LSSFTSQEKVFQTFIADSPAKYLLKPELGLSRITEETVELFSEDCWEYTRETGFFNFLEFQPYSEKRESDDYLQSSLRRFVDREHLFWFITCRKESKTKAIGSIRLTNIDYQRGHIEIGYGLSNSEAGKGYYRDALRAVTNYAHKDLGFYKVISRTRWDNFASIVGLEREGYKFEGRARDDQLRYDGVRFDVVNYSSIGGSKGE
jgi:RimJ/RimL family protein N-acetyltransferase